MQPNIKFFWLIFSAIFYSLAWLIPNHFMPWLGFHSDALAALVLLLLSLAVVFKAKLNIHWHGLAILVLLFLLVISAQYAFGLIFHLGVAWINALYVFGFLVALLVGSLWERSATLECADFLFWTVVFGATASLGLQIHQWLGLGWLGDWVISSKQSRYYANMAQPNQLGSLFFLGIVGCGWIYVRGKAHAIVATLLAAALFFGLALTESRTGWLNAGLLAIALVGWHSLAGKRPSASVVVFLLVFYGCCVLAVPSLNAWVGSNGAPQEVRSLMDHARLSIWAMVLDAAWLKPWTGYGWGQVSHAQFMPGVGQLDFAGNVQQSHNLILDLILWNGIPIGVLASVFLAWWAFKVLVKISTIEQLLMVLFLSVLFSHAMLEFPLQYAYFLLLAGLMMGVINSNLNFQVFLTSPKWMGFFLILVAAVAFGVTVRDYFLVEKSFYGLRFEQRKIATNIPKTPPETFVLTQLRDHIIFARKDPASFHDLEDIKWAEGLVKILPSALGMYKLSAMYAFADNADAARYWMRNACTMNNIFQCEAVKELWAQQAIIHPAMKKIEWEEK